MVLLVEDGTGLVDANGYVDVAYVTQYLTERARESVWVTLTPVAQEAAVIKATDYINLRFQGYFQGEKLTSTQALEFPRVYTIPPDRYDYGLMPVRLLKATCEYAIRAAVAELLSDETEGKVKSFTNKVGPIEEKKDYYEFPDAQGFSALYPASYIKPYPAADLLIEPLLKRLTPCEVIRH